MNDTPNNPPPQPPAPRPGQIQFELNEKEAEGIYANVCFIQSSASEIVIDFARMVPNVAKSRIQSRIIMTPYNAKAMLMSLEETIKRYEAQFGPLKLGNPGDAPRIGF